jgi:hypothetical protein
MRAIELVFHLGTDLYFVLYYLAGLVNANAPVGCCLSVKSSGPELLEHLPGGLCLGLLLGHPLSPLPHLAQRAHCTHSSIITGTVSRE